MHLYGFIRAFADINNLQCTVWFRNILSMCGCRRGQGVWRVPTVQSSLKMKCSPWFTMRFQFVFAIRFTFYGFIYGRVRVEVKAMVVFILLSLNLTHFGTSWPTEQQILIQAGRPRRISRFHPLLERRTVPHNWRTRIQRSVVYLKTIQYYYHYMFPCSYVLVNLLI